jgi:hypothetical protein
MFIFPDECSISERLCRQRSSIFTKPFGQPRQPNIHDIDRLRSMDTFRIAGQPRIFNLILTEIFRRIVRL